MLAAQRLRLQLYIIPMEQVPGTFEKVWRIAYCRNFFVVKLEEWFHLGNTQQFEGLDIVDTRHRQQQQLAVQYYDRCHEPLSKIAQSSQP
jgi:hypothetical protein